MSLTRTTADGRYDDARARITLFVAVANAYRNLCMQIHDAVVVGHPHFVGRSINAAQVTAEHIGLGVQFQ